MQGTGVDQDVLDAGGVRFEERGEVATVTLDRPRTRNAQTPATWDALRIIGSALGRDVRVVVVRGAGETFSSGLDRRMLEPGGTTAETSVLALVDLPDGELAESIAPTSRASPGCADPGSSASPPYTATPSAPASSSRWPATCGCSPTTRGSA